MSSTSSNSPMALPAEEEPRKKGSRGGKRSVTHLSKAQLARKRANDREAQRNIRQRTKEHIENLERKVKELEQGCRSGSMERVLQRNRELEDEVEKLRAQVASNHASPVPRGQLGPDIPDELLIPQKVELDWMPASAWSQDVNSHMANLDQHSPIPASNAPYPSSEAQIYPPTTSSMSYEEEPAQQQQQQQQQQLYTPTSNGVWEHYNQQQTTQGLTKSVPAWAPPFHPAAFSQSSRFSDLQPSSALDDLVGNTHAPYNDNNNNNNNNNSTCWQSQPNVYAWQLPTKLKAPITSEVSIRPPATQPTRAYRHAEKVQ